MTKAGEAVLPAAGERGRTGEHLVFDGLDLVDLRPVPVEAPGTDEVIIESECSLISAGTEVSVLSRRHDPDSAWAGMQRFPFYPGYSNVGTVVEAGAGATAWIGERVSSHAPHASVVRWPAAELRRIPQAVPSDPASLCTLAEVVLNAIRRSPVALGSRCAVLGLGLIGQITCRLLAVAGASVVWCRDPDPRRSGLVPSGAPYQVAPDAAPPEDFFDVTFEASGHPAAMSLAGTVTRAGGVIAVVSSPSAPTTFDFHDACNRKSLSIVGSHYFSHPPAGQRWDARQNGEYFLELIERDIPLWSALITEQVAAAEAPARYRSLQAQPATAGVVIRWR